MFYISLRFMVLHKSCDLSLVLDINREKIDFSVYKARNFECKNSNLNIGI
jgi:hypothetical protein